MSQRESTSRCILIIKKLRKFPASYNEIADYLALESEIQGYNYNVSKRTFQRDLEDIRSLYNIDIQYDFSLRKYYIDIDQNEPAYERIMEAFDTFNALNVSDRISDCIHFENRRPQGTEHLYGLLHAIKNKFQIQFTYEKYYNDKKSLRTVSPYALKEFRNRWYVIAKDFVDDKIKTFALDRLSDLVITQQHFVSPGNFDIQQYFKYCFGIMAPNAEEPSEVVLAFSEFQGKYIKSLPLHHTQSIIEDDKELVVKLKVFITEDFIMELLSYGDQLRVIKPKSLADEIKEMHRAALERYK